MTKSTRLFEIIQLLRVAQSPVRASDIAEELEVSKRTIYRDIASLQATRVPIEGEAGIGYALACSYELPPLNFDAQEAEAITIGLAMIGRAGDADLQKAARRAARKLREATGNLDHFYSSQWGVVSAQNVDASTLRGAIRSERVLQLTYHDSMGSKTNRTIWPLAMLYYVEAAVLAAWCELRQDFRHFRLDRMTKLHEAEVYFHGKGKELREKWQETMDLP